MSRVLADLLGVGPKFRLGLQQLEKSSGMPRADIRLVDEINREVRAKLLLLRLDPKGTTGQELYRALAEKLKSDEKLVREALGLVADATNQDILQAVQLFLSKETASYTIFAVKPTVLRSILKKLKPKVTMKALGYRSMDSMFKHEPILQLMAATMMIESAEWHKARLAAYAKLKPSNFELRKVSYSMPLTKKWPELASKYTAAQRHNMLVVPEAGGVVFLPVETELPGLTILSIVMGLQALADIRSRSALLKLQQVQPDFGETFRVIAEREPMTDVTFGGQQLSWRFVHWFYGSVHSPEHPEIFEPHLQPDDFAQHDPHATLVGLNDALQFWQNSHVLGMLDGSDVVSFNIFDVALGVCNGLGYDQRFLHNMRDALGREVVARYLHGGNLQAMLEDTLGKQLTPEFEFD